MSHSYNKFIILSSPRSGTHMLRSSLDSHPNIVCLSEMFNPDYTEEDYPFTPDTPETEILNEFIFCHYPPEVQAVGFCIHRVGARFGNWPDLWDRLELMEDLNVISLRRDNLLRRYLSFQIRNYQDLVENLPDPMEFQTELLIKDFERQRSKIAEFDARFSRHPMVTLTYEQLCGDYDRSLRSAQALLGVPKVPVEPGTKRRATPSMTDIIANYHELKAEFADTPWAGFFDE